MASCDDVDSSHHTAHPGACSFDMAISQRKVATLSRMEVIHSTKMREDWNALSTGASFDRWDAGLTEERLYKISGKVWKRVMRLILGRDQNIHDAFHTWCRTILYDVCKKRNPRTHDAITVDGYSYLSDSAMETDAIMELVLHYVLKVERNRFYYDKWISSIEESLIALLFPMRFA
jgi:hypothetical protein